MTENNNDMYKSAKQVFYDAFDNGSILGFGNEFAGMFAGTVENIYRLQDGIHIGIKTNMDGVTEDEIMDVFSAAAKEFVYSITNDDSLAAYTKNNISSLSKILFIDKWKFTIII